MTDIITAEGTVGTELLRLVAGIRRALRRRVGNTGGVSQLTDAQRELVRYVRLHPGCRIGEAASALHLAHNTVSTLVGALAGLGWLEREPDPEDARSTRLCLSAKAEAGVAEWRDRRANIVAAALEQLSPQERQEIEQALPKLRALLTLLQEPS